MVADFVGKPMRVDQRALDAAGEEQLEPIIEQRLAVDRDKAFRYRLSDGAETLADAGGEEEGAHENRYTDLFVALPSSGLSGHLLPQAGEGVLNAPHLAPRAPSPACGRGLG